MYAQTEYLYGGQSPVKVKGEETESIIQFLDTERAKRIPADEMHKYIQQIPLEERNPTHDQALTFFDLYVGQGITVYSCAGNGTDTGRIYLRAVVLSEPEIGPDDMWWIDTDMIDHRGNVTENRRACLGVWGVTKCHKLNGDREYRPEWNQHMYVLPGIHEVNDTETGLIYFTGSTACNELSVPSPGTLPPANRAA